MRTAPHAGTGIEITDVDLRTIDDEGFAEIRALFDRHGLLFFRDQQLSETDHIALAERFGTINVNRFFTQHPDHPEIAMVAKAPDQRFNVGGGWHTDHSYDVEPALGSILVARELPSSGGDTHFVSAYDAFDALPTRMQDRLRTMRAVHSAKRVFGSTAQKIMARIDPKSAMQNAMDADTLGTVTHPVVIRHPLSGREALYVNPGFTVRFEGMSAPRSLPLLLDIYRRVLTAGKTARYQWEPGSVAMWDNRATWHFAKNDYRGEQRIMHRITLDGCALEAALDAGRHTGDTVEDAGATAAA